MTWFRNIIGLLIAPFFWTNHLLWQLSYSRNASSLYFVINPTGKATNQPSWRSRDTRLGLSWLETQEKSAKGAEKALKIACLFKEFVAIAKLTFDRSRSFESISFFLLLSTSRLQQVERRKWRHWQRTSPIPNPLTESPEVAVSLSRAGF